MTFNLLENIAYCKDFVSEISGIILYSHLLPLTTVLIFSVFILVKARFNEISKILFSIAICFTFWCVLNLTIWFGYLNSDIVMAAWTPIEIFNVGLFILCLHFVHLFVRNQKPTIWHKTVWTTIFLPVVIIPITNQYLLFYDVQECVAIENNLYITYVSVIKLFLSLWIFYELIRILVIDNKKRIENFLLGVGMSMFVFSFYISGFISEKTENYKIELYGIYGMIVFIGIMSYLVVKYSLFNVKMIATQALIWGLVILVGAQFFYATNTPSNILTSVTLIFTGLLGINLMRSVKKEIKAKEQIQMLAQDLSKANVRLKELDQQKSEFISLASHQIRGPLASIKGYVSMILEGDFGVIKKDLKDVMETIFSSTQSLVVLVGDFLDISRIEQGRMKYDYTDFNLEELAKTAVREIEPTVEIKKLGISFIDAQKGDYMVHADQGKMKQIILNIIDNSVKYTKEGSIKIGLERKNNKIHLFVKDTGVGIAPEVLPKLFEKFTRAPDASKTNILGTGLGLYVAKKMIEAQDGRIWAVSEGVGKGSEFHIELNAKNRDTEAELPSGVKNFAKDL